MVGNHHPVFSPCSYVRVIVILIQIVTLGLFAFREMEKNQCLDA